MARAMMRQGIALMLMAGVSVAGAAQTFKSRVESVRLDALVLDRGRPVVGLRADDFDIRDNGARQAVTLLAPARCRWTSFSSST